MIKKSYNIRGFDCANCAAKVEAHLNKNDKIEMCRIDFAGNRLHLTFKDKELSIDDIKALISEVETDLIEITPIEQKATKAKIFTASFYFTLARILYGVLAIIISAIFFEENFWVTFGIYLSAIILLTYDILWRVIKHIIHLENPLDEYLLISLSVYGAFAIAAIQTHDFMDSVMVVALFQAGRLIEGVATNKSKEAIMAAVDLRVEVATKICPKCGLVKLKPEDLKIGDVVLVNIGEIIPVDGEIIEGDAFIDVSSLTGEYVPVSAKVGEAVYAGCSLKSGSLKIKVTKEYKDSTVSKIIELVSNSGERKSKADKFITKFARWYTPSVFAGSVLFAVIGGLVTGNWVDFLFNGLKLLVVACPCAIVISVPMAYFSAIGLASKKGIVIKGTNFLDELTKIRVLATDKTGTLTHGVFLIQSTHFEGVNKEEFFEYLFAAESLSSHPVGKAICHGKDLKKIALAQKDYQEIPGLGIITNYKDKRIVAGSVSLMAKEGITIPSVTEGGVTVYVSVEGRYIGHVILNDEIKEDAQPMVDLLHNEDVEIVLLTGDKEDNAKEVCTRLGIDRWYSDLNPEEKTSVLERIIAENAKHTVAYIGDGINDAASIRRSDIGIAMGGIGSDVAVDNADIVIMNDDPAKVYDAIKIAKMARNTSIFNIVAALTIKIGLEITTIIATILNNPDLVPMWVAVLADTGLTVLLVINSLILLYRKVKRPL